MRATTSQNDKSPFSSAQEREQQNPTSHVPSRKSRFSIDSSYRIVWVWGLCAIALCMGMSESLFAASVIYSDTFNIDTGTAGSGGRVGFSDAWTEEVGKAQLSISPTGTEAFMSTGTNLTIEETDFVQITHVFSTTGFTDILVELTAFQSGTTWEQDFDRLEILYSTDGSIFTSLLLDAGAWTGVNDPLGSGTPAGNTTPTSTGLLALPGGADNNPLFSIRIRGIFNAAAEDYFLASFQLQGDALPAVPEPSTYAMFLMGLVGIGLMIRRRKKKQGTA